MAQCKDCKYLDFTQKTSVGYVCTNTTRRKTMTWGGCKTMGHLKAPTTKACKSGFKPREEQE